jgi:predicted aspartyl protease
MEESLAVLEDESDNPRPSCHLATKIASTDTKLAPIRTDAYRMRGYGLDVKLNGVTAHLLLDTGASGILLDRKIAEKAGIKPVVHTKIRGIGDKGDVGGFMGTVDSIKIGDLEFQGCYAEVADRRSVVDTDGLIGADVFSRFLIELNFPDAKFKLSELPPIPNESAGEISLESHPASALHLHDRYIAPEMRDYTPIFKFNDHLLISTKVNDSAPKLFMIDTGAFDDTISPQAARETTHVSGDSQTTVKGVNGSVAQVYRADNVTLQFSRFRQKRNDLIAFDLTGISNNTGTEVSGILGFAMLQMLDIKIDYRDGLVDFTYDEHRFH